MCGILGTFNKKVNDADFLNALNTIKHRGPDGFGIWFEEHGLCQLGHRRLSIIDLSELGKQPMISSSGRYVITFNGEIYNYVEIKKQLVGLGCSFRGNSDTEVLVNAYEQWGDETFSKLNGMWSLAIFDNKNKELILARDRFGIKPLFYCLEPDGGIIFASEMKAIAPIMHKCTPNVKLLLNPTEYMFEYESTQECLIKDIKRVEPGHYLRICINGITVKRWWNTLDNLVDVPKTYDEQCELFRELFLDSCRLRMRSDVLLGTALSGGLDSSATICAMAHISRKMNDDSINRDSQKAFIASFSNSELDETEYAHEVTNYLGLAKRDVIIDPKKGMEDLPTMFYMFEEIYNTSPVPMVQTYNALRKDGVIVTLDGHGADELFGGYDYTVLSALKDVRPFSEEINGIIDTYKEMQMDCCGDNSSYQKIYWDYIVRNTVRNILGKKNVGYVYDGENREALSHMSYMNRTLYNAFHITTLPTLLRNYDRYSMMNSVEIRMPFMDYRIVQYAFSLEHNAKIRSGYSKAIIRDSLRDLIPSSVVNRKKKIGFNTPINEWIVGPWKEWLLDEINSTEFTNSDYTSKILKDNANDLIIGKQPSLISAIELWNKLSPYFWEKYFYKRVLHF